MLDFGSMADRDAIQDAMPWADRDVPATFHAMLSRTAATWPNHKAATFQLTSGLKDAGRTQTWDELLRDTNRAANLLRTLGVGPATWWRTSCPTRWRRSTSSPAG